MKTFVRSGSTPIHLLVFLALLIGLPLAVDWATGIGARSAAEAALAPGPVALERGQRLAPTSAMSATIAGTVRDAGTGLPLAGATVHAEGPDWNTTATTDVDGAYMLTVAASSGRVYAGKAGYVGSYNQTVSVTDGQRIDGINFTLAAATAWIVGTVRQVDGTPLPDVNVWLNCQCDGGFSSNVQVDATGDATGVYTAGVVAGTWTVHAGPWNYTMSRTPVVTVTDGQVLTGTDLWLLTNTVTVTGQVRDQAGDGMGRVHLEPRDADTGYWLSWGTDSDAGGYYTLTLPVGTWRVAVAGVGGRSGYRVPGSQAVTVGEGETRSGVDFTLTALNATIAGVVRDGAGVPVVGASVNTGVPGWGTNATTDASGTYTLTVYGGSWNVHASKAGYAGSPNRQVTVGEGEHLTGVDFVLTALNSTIAGTVRDAVTGSSLAGARVYANGPNWGTNATTDASGAYTLTVFGGTWWAGARKPGYVGVSHQVAVADGQSLSGLDFTLPPATAWIVGTVWRGDGVPLAGMNVWINRLDGEGENEGNTDPTGVYTMPVVAGRWNVKAGPSSYTMLRTPVVTVTTGQVLTGTDLWLLTNSVTVTGQVRDQVGNGISGVHVEPRDPDTSHWLSNGTDSDARGYYTLTLPVGTWRLAVAGSVAGLSGYRTPGNQTVTLGDGEARGGVDFILTALNATIAGVVRDGAGLPVAGATVNTGIPDWGTSATTDASGAYTLTVYGGTWNVGVGKQGYTFGGRTVTVGDGQHLSGVDFALTAFNSTIAGTVRDVATGSSLAGARVYANGPNWGTNATTDASGAYTLTVAAGSWLVNADKAGYVGSYNRTVNVGDGQRVDGVDFSLTVATAWIVGTVRLGDGTAVPGRNVWTWPQRWNGPGGTHGNADATGVYTLSVVAGSWYVIGGPAAGQTLSRTPVVTVTSGQTLTGTDLWLLTNTVTVTGQVRDQLGNGISGVHVEPRDPDTSHWLSNGTNSDAGGYYTLTLPVGTWRLAVAGSVAGLSSYRTPGNQTVTLSEGETRSGVDFVLTALNATISGIVRDGAGLPVAGASVNTGVPGWGTSATTDAGGAYTLTVYAGTWDVNVSKPGYRQAGANRQVTVGDGEHVTGIDLPLRALNATITGMVRDVATGLAVGGANIRAYGAEWSTGATTDATGAYTLTVSPGVWYLNVDTAGYLRGSRTVNVGDGQRLSGIDFNLTPGTATITGTLRYGTGGTVANQWVYGSAGKDLVSNPNADASGVYTMPVTAGTWTLHSRLTGYTLQVTPRVVIADGQTIGGIDLVFLPNNATVTGRVQILAGAGLPGVWVRGNDAGTGQPVTQDYVTDVSGTYTLPIAAGVWQVYAQSLSGYRFSPGQTITVAAGELRAGVDFTATALNATISGVVRDGAGLPVAGASVNTGVPGWGASATTDASGAYTLTVYSGTWNVSVSKQGYSSWSSTVTVGDAGHVAGIDFIIRALNATIAGVVRDAASNLPVVGARVDTGNGPWWRTVVTTDATGAYTLTVSGGTWTVNVSSLGYLRGRQTVTVGDGGRADGVDISLTPGTATMTGTVRYSTGGTVPNQWVYGEEQTTRGVSNPTADASGAYTMSVTAGTWTLHSRRTGYTLRETPRVVITESQTIGGIDLVFLPNNATVSGRVLDQNGLPVAGARVNGADAGTGYPVTQDAVPDTSGTYTLPIAAGAWKLSVSAAGYSSASRAVTVTTGPTLSGVDFVLQQTGSIAGTVRNADGSAPLAGARVRAVRSDASPPSPSGAVCSDAAGNYRLDNLPFASYRVYARGGAGCGSSSRYVTEYYHERAASSYADLVVISSTAPITGVDFTLDLGGLITGTVRARSTGAALSGMPVLARLVADSNVSISACTDSSGAYTIPGVAAGAYTIRASPGGQGCRGDARYLPQYWNDRGNPDAADPVTMTLGMDATGIDFTLDLGGTVSGNLSYSGLVTGTHRIYISAHTPPYGPPTYYSSTLGLGPYAIVGLADGVYTIHAYLDADDDSNPWWGSPGGPPPQQSEPDDPRARYGVPITIANGSAVTGVDLVLRDPSAGGSISGHVYEVDGVTPLAGALVEVAVARSDVLRNTVGRTTTAANGSYTIAGLTGGGYELKAWRLDRAREFYREQSDFVGVTLDVITVTAPYDVPGIDFTLEPGGAITGTVRNADGSAPVQAAVWLHSLDGESPERYIMCAGSDGTYSIGGLRFGAYKATARTTRMCGDNRWYEKEYYDDSADWGSADVVTISTTSPVGDVDFTLSQGGPVEVWPDRGPAYAPYPILIAGSGFVMTPTVTLGTYPLLVRFTANESLYAVVPPGLPRGTYSLTVTNPDGHWATLPAAYTVYTVTVVPPIGPVRVSNVTDNGLTLSWLTPLASAEVVDGVRLGFGGADEPGVYAADVRGWDYTTEEHYHELGPLRPASAYLLSIRTADGGGPTAQIIVTTGLTIDTIPPVDPIRGYLYEADGITPAAGAIVYLRVVDADGQGTPGESTLLSALVGGDGSWLIDLPARRADLQEYFAYGGSDRFELFAEGGRRGAMVRQVSAGGPRLLPGLYLVAPAAVEVQPGWTNLALPHREVGPYTASSLLAELAAQGLEPVQLARWRDGRWESHIRDFAANDFPIEAGQGYFVRTGRAGVWHPRPANGW